MEGTVSALLMGGFFGLLLVPVGFALLLVGLAPAGGRGPPLPQATVRYLLLPLAIAYVVQILLLDRTHRVVHVDVLPLGGVRPVGEGKREGGRFLPPPPTASTSSGSTPTGSIASR